MTEQNKVNKNTENDGFYNQVHDWSRHYDSTLWTVTSIFIVANSALLTYTYSQPSFDKKLSIIGVILTLISFFFAASFRSLRRKLNDYLDSIGKKEEIQYLRSPLPLFKQWPIYLFIHFIFLGFWFEKIGDRTPVWWICLILSIFVLITYYVAADNCKLKDDESKKNRKSSTWKSLLESVIIFIFALIVILLVFYICL